MASDASVKPDEEVANGSHRAVAVDSSGLVTSLDRQDSRAVVVDDVKAEAVTTPTTVASGDATSPTSATAASDPQAQALRMREYVVRELLDSEQVYVDDLGKIVDGYLSQEVRDELAVPDDLEGKDKMVFANIRQIHEWHRDVFQKQLAASAEKPEKLADVFMKYERRLHMYVIYCQNKPKSEYIVSEHVDGYYEEVRQRLGHRLKLPDLLIKPVQRIMKYQLILRDLIKYSERAGVDASRLRTAVETTCVAVCKLANDSMEVGRLSGFDGKLAAQGRLILQDTFCVAEYSNGATTAAAAISSSDDAKFKERRVFLFEQIIIFSEIRGGHASSSQNSSSGGASSSGQGGQGGGASLERQAPKGQMRPFYLYRDHIQLNKLTCSDSDAIGADSGTPPPTGGERPPRFVLKQRDPHHGDKHFLLDAQGDRAKCERWLLQIRTMLDSQQNFLRALQSPIDFQRQRQSGAI